MMADSPRTTDDKKLETFLQSVGTANYPHAHGRSLFDHLKGTRDILRCWSQPACVETAGLFHSIYSTDVYRRQVLDVSEREQLQLLIGEKAERLVYLFHKLSRKSFFDQLFKLPSVPVEGLTIAVDNAGEAVELTLDSAEVQGLIVVHMANEAEQTCLADGRPGVWLARVSELGAQARKAGGEPPAVFEKCSIRFSFNDERLLNESYLQAFETISDADTHFEQCSKICPWIAEPLILRAYLKALNGDLASARVLSVQATNVLDQWGTAWDKRLSWWEWKRLAAVLQSETELDQIKQLSAEFLQDPRVLCDQVASCTRVPVDREEKTRLAQYISSFADAGTDPRKRIYPQLPAQPWHDPQSFPIVAALEAAYEQIRAEVKALDEGDFHQESETIARVGSWDVFFFYERGNKNIKNCARCPSITSIIEQHETLRTHAGLIYLSRLRPGTHISAHRGPTNLRVRCHLGVEVPEGDCGLRVGSEIGSWQQGRCIVFDDYYEHEAWNRTDEHRLVLIVDLWHPALTTYEREVLRGLQQYAFAHAQDLHRYWIENMKAKFMVGAASTKRSAMQEYH